MPQIPTRGLRRLEIFGRRAGPSHSWRHPSLPLVDFPIRCCSRASLELELIALRHQVTVLRRQRPGSRQLDPLDRLLWMWLYRTWPQVIDAMVLVEPTTVVQWHRKGFRLYWRCTAAGITHTGTEIRELIRRE